MFTGTIWVLTHGHMATQKQVRGRVNLRGSCLVERVGHGLRQAEAERLKDAAALVAEPLLPVKPEAQAGPRPRAESGADLGYTFTHSTSDSK